jgi:site-specific DNA recombinase
MRRRTTSEAQTRRIRCAIYTRKSTDENLDNGFNSLDAQREAAEAYIASQRHEGWVALPNRYDDGGFSGSNMERPGLQRLLEDVGAGRIDCVVVYKVDRLSRSLLDFARIIEAFDRRGVSFVSVTQQFNTTTSMGRLTLNILLSFAQFEREIIGERIRDKVAATKRKGKYTGGVPVLGYGVDRVNHRLVINPQEADLVRHVFRRFIAAGSTTELAKELNAQGHTTKSWTSQKGQLRPGRPWNKGHVYRILNNLLYLGEVTHRGNRYPGEHEAIVPRDLWDKAHTILTTEREPPPPAQRRRRC